MGKCERCGGFMIQETATDYYIKIVYEKCMCCNRRKELHAIEYKFRKEEEVTA